MGWKIKYSAVFLDFTFDNEILFGLCDCPNEVGLSLERLKKSSIFLIIIFGVNVIGEIVYLAVFSNEGRGAEFI